MILAGRVLTIVATFTRFLAGHRALLPGERHLT
jgi:hypothetical protein